MIENKRFIRNHIISKIGDDNKIIQNYHDPFSAKDPSDVYVGHAVVDYLSEMVTQPDTVRNLEIKYYPVICGFDFLWDSAKKDLVEYKVRSTDDDQVEAFIKRRQPDRIGLPGERFTGYYVMASYSAMNNDNGHIEDGSFHITVHPEWNMSVVNRAIPIFNMYGNDYWNKYRYNSEKDIIRAFSQDIRLVPWCNGDAVECTVPDKWKQMHEK